MSTYRLVYLAILCIYYFGKGDEGKGKIIAYKEKASRWKQWWWKKAWNDSWGWTNRVLTTLVQFDLLRSALVCISIICYLPILFLLAISIDHLANLLNWLLTLAQAFCYSSVPSELKGDYIWTEKIVEKSVKSKWDWRVALGQKEFCGCGNIDCSSLGPTLMNTQVS